MFTQESVEFNDDAAGLFGVNQTLVLWLVVLGLAIFFVPLYLIGATLQQDVARLEADTYPLQTVLADAPAVLPQEEELAQQLVTLEQQADQVEALQQSLAQRDVDWSGVVAALNNYAPSEMALFGMAQNERQLTLQGRAINDGVVVAYARRLEESGQFSSVVLQSIVLVETPFGSPTPLPPTETAVTATPTPTTAATSTSAAGGGVATATRGPTQTPTAVLHDEYEWDDVHPGPIFIGQPQVHNFYPEFDVDNVSFLAKAGRYYEIATSNLAPGVDTFLTVSFGGAVLTNDDAEAGTLRSLVRIQAPADRDVDVVAQITNRGPYGPQMTYTIQVIEIVPTPTPTTPPTTPTMTPTPTITLTPSPTATTPPTATATPDLRDEFEPNDQTPGPIAIGETQRHNFYPQGDVDKVSFLVKNGRTYQVVTSELALGVDTKVAVQLGDDEWENDDYDAPGSGNFASAVCFTAGMDGTAVATLSNVSPQYAPDKAYSVTVQEAPLLLTNKTALTFGPVLAGDPNPAPQQIALSGTEPLEWTATTETAWLTLDLNSGVTPATIAVFADSTGRPPGVYAGEIVLGWSQFCRQTIPVIMQIDAPPSGDAGGTLASADRPRLRFVAKPAQQGETAVEFVIVVELRTP